MDIIINIKDNMITSFLIGKDNPIKKKIGIAYLNSKHSLFIFNINIKIIDKRTNHLLMKSLHGLLIKTSRAVGDKDKNE